MPSIRQLLANTTHVVVSAVLLAGMGFAASAQAAPDKPLRIIVPYPPGGILDTLMRRMAPVISPEIDQPVIVDNRPGGLTNIGMRACATAPTDGSVVCFALLDSILYNPLLFKDIPYDPMSLVPVIQLASARSIIVANASAPFNSYGEMIEFSKANPGALNFGTWGPGSTPDLYRQWIGRSASTELTPIPYRGVGGGTMQAILAGEIDATLFSIGQILPYLKEGKVKPIAIVGAERWSGLPEVPSLGELGADPGLAAIWGIYAPAGTAKAQVDHLNAEFGKALEHPSIREALEANTMDPLGGTADEFAKALQEQREVTRQTFDTLGIEPLDNPT